MLDLDGRGDANPDLRDDDTHNNPDLTWSGGR